MELSFYDFISQLSGNYTLLIITILISSVIFVNGCSDSPNTIATCIATRSIKPKNAIIMASVFNFLGVFVMTTVSSNVAQTLFKIANFGENYSHALIALCAGMVAIVLWNIFAWIFGMPTSQSHALIAGISGAAICIQKSISGISINEWIKVIVGLFLSIILSFVVGFIITRIIERKCKNFDRRRLNSIFKKLQVFSGASMAFMHGAQDGQKYIGIFLLGIALSKGNANIRKF